MSENKDCNFSVRISEIEMAELNRMSAKMNIPKAVLAREGIAFYLRRLSPKAFKTNPIDDKTHCRSNGSSCSELQTSSDKTANKAVGGTIILPRLEP